MRLIVRSREEVRDHHRLVRCLCQNHARPREIRINYVGDHMSHDCSGRKRQQKRQYSPTHLGSLLSREYSRTMSDYFSVGEVPKGRINQLAHPGMLVEIDITAVVNRDSI